MYQPSQDPWRACAQSAANYIRVHGHCKGAYRNAKGEVCLMGALLCVMTDMSTVQEVFKRCNSIIGPTIGIWNDHPSRTAQEVIDLLELVAVS